MFPKKVITVRKPALYMASRWIHCFSIIIAYEWFIQSKFGKRYDIGYANLTI